ncbi:NAD(P)-dependent oxidoreductase [Candidatus Peregrinibacteria bacterium]|nr:NAD(P)-dependent oxidoreductase [Candidatus Peregrinibacteria bacterium]
MIKTILLTGATGFVGSHLLKELLERKHDVVILKRSSSDLWRIKEFLPQVKSYDIDKEGIAKPFIENKIDCVIHLGVHYVKFHQTLEDIEKTIDFNVKTATLLAELAVKNNVNFFLNTGSFFEYKMQDHPIKEGDELSPYNLYAASKVAFNEILKFYSANFPLKVIDLKLFAPYGEKDQDKVLVFLIKSLLEGKKVDFSGGEQKWNFTYVRDIVNAYLKALDYFKNDFQYESFNIGQNQTHSLSECVEILEKISGKKLDINFGAKPYVEKEIFHVNCDNFKAAKMLDFKPAYNLESGLKLMYYYYKNF